jgi:hypothetical protein
MNKIILYLNGVFRFQNLKMLIVIPFLLVMYFWHIKKDNDITITKTFETYNPKNQELMPFTQDIRFGFEFVVKNQKLINKTWKGLDKQQKGEILSIVFPEITRWEKDKDVIEIFINEEVYVRGGSKIGNFSIGCFQMKPSFIEQLEGYITQNEELKDLNELVLNNANNQINRKERIQRLKSVEWQLRYAYAFWTICNHRFKNLTFSSPNEKIRWMATAYNTGFMKPIEVIHNWETKRMFPYGKSPFFGKNVSYGDFSEEFYNNYFIFSTIKS